MHRKIFIVLCSLVLCIPVLAVSVSATTFDLEDFIDSGSFDGTVYRYRYLIPASDNGKFLLSSGSHSLPTFTGKHFGFNVGLHNLKVDDYLTMVYYPFGDSNYFDLGTTGPHDFRLASGSLKWDQTNRTSGLSVVIGSEKVRIFFYDKFYNQLSIWEGDPDIDTLSVPGKAQYFNIQFTAKFLITAQVISCTMDNIILTNIVSASESTQQGILGPAGEYYPPSNGSVVGDLDDVENGLLGGLDSAKNSIVQFANNAKSSLASILSTFALISSLVTVFFQFNAWAYPLFYVSLTVGVFALLVNVSASFVGGKHHD